MANQITLLKDVDIKRHHLKIRVRIGCLWHQRSTYNGTESNTLEMLLLDEQGNRMQGSVNKKYVSRFQNCIAEGSVYEISNFGVVENTTRFKMVDKPDKITFYGRTKASEYVGDFQGPLYGFSFAKYTSVLNVEVNPNLALDIIGVLSSCGKVEPKEVDGRATCLLSFELESIEGKQLPCTLWGSFAHEVFEHVSTHGQSPIVVIIHQGWLREYLARGQITNCFYGTKVFVDADIDEVHTFHSSYLSHKGIEGNQHTIVNIADRRSKSVMHDFLVTSRKENIREMRDTRKPGKYVVVGRIAVVTLDPTWSYLACPKCLSGVHNDVEEEDASTHSNTPGDIGVWTCDRCILRGVDAIRRFRVVVRVEDSTGRMSLTLFDREVFGAVKLSAAELFAKLRVGEEDDTIPSELEVLVGREYAFIANITSFNIRTSQANYTVSKMTDAKEVIGKLRGSLTDVQDAAITSPAGGSSLPLTPGSSTPQVKESSQDAELGAGSVQPPMTPAL